MICYIENVPKYEGIRYFPKMSVQYMKKKIWVGNYIKKRIVINFIIYIHCMVILSNNCIGGNQEKNLFLLTTNTIGVFVEVANATITFGIPKMVRSYPDTSRFSRFRIFCYNIPFCFSLVVVMLVVMLIWMEWFMVCNWNWKYILIISYTDLNEKIVKSLYQKEHCNN